MRRDDRSYLLDMLIAARDAVAFAKGLSYDEFATDRRSQLAILKLVEIVGTAADPLRHPRLAAPGATDRGRPEPWIGVAPHLQPASAPNRLHRHLVKRVEFGAA